MTEPERPEGEPVAPHLPPPPSPTDGPVPGAPRRRRRVPLVVALVLGVAAIAGAATYVSLGPSADRSADRSTGPDTPLGSDPASLALAFDPGQSWTYDIALRMDGSIQAGSLGTQPLAMDLEETVGWRVVKVDHQGVATVEVSARAVSGQANGMPLPASSEPTMTLRIGPDGQIVGTSGSSLAAGSGLGSGFGSGLGLGSFPGMDQVTPILPDHPVKPGDTWQKTFSQDIPFVHGTVEYTSTSTFDRYQTIDGVRAAVITTRYTVPMNFSIDLGKLGSAFGGLDDGNGSGKIPPNATIRYAGRGTFTQTSWIDPRGKDLLRTTSDGDFDLKVDFPAASAALGGEPIAISATFHMQVDKR